MAATNEAEQFNMVRDYVSKEQLKKSQQIEIQWKGTQSSWEIGLPAYSNKAIYNSYKAIYNTHIGKIAKLTLALITNIHKYLNISSNL